MKNKWWHIGLLVGASLWSSCQASRIERCAQRFYNQDSQPLGIAIRQGQTIQTSFRLETHIDCGCICNIRAVQAVNVADSSIVQLQHWEAQPVLLSGKRAAPNVGMILNLRLHARQQGTTQLIIRGDRSRYPCEQCKWNEWQTSITLTTN